MTLIERLRDYNRMHAAKEMIEAADRIEQLEAALRHLIDEGDHVNRWVLADKARKALAPGAPSKDWCLNMARLEGEAEDPDIAVGEVAADPALAPEQDK